MTLEQLGSLGEFVSAIAVVVSLLYLAVQIRQNTSAVRSTSHQAVLDAAQRIQTTLIQSPEMASLLTRANREYGSLTPEERVRFSAYAGQYFSTWQAAFLNHDRSLLDSETWRHMDALSVRHLGPALREFWRKERDTYVQAFRAHVDGAV